MKTLADNYQKHTLNHYLFEQFIQLFDSLKSQIKDNKIHIHQVEPLIIQGVMNIAKLSIAELLMQYDCDHPHIEVSEKSQKHPSLEAKKLYTWAGKSPQTIYTSAGEITINRSYYRTPDHTESFFPVDVQAGLINRFTPHAVKMITLITAEMTPNAGAKLLKEFGGMSPSKSTLDRVSKQTMFQGEWLSASMIFRDEIPINAVKVSVSLDGVMVRKQSLKGDSRFASDGETGEVYNIEDKNGYSKFREATCGAITFYDNNGEKIKTHQYGRMPEYGKGTVKSQLIHHVEWIKMQRADLEFIVVADGAKDNWTFFEANFPTATQVLDFFHAAEHLKIAVDEVYKKDADRAFGKFKAYQHWLRHDDYGVDRVIVILEIASLNDEENKVLKRELNYFKNNRKRCYYQKISQRKEPIGSGVIESLCKTLVTQRLKLSGMAWLNKGGQCILSMRAILHSDLYDEAWSYINTTMIKSYNVKAA